MPKVIIELELTNDEEDIIQVLMDDIGLEVAGGKVNGAPKSQLFAYFLKLLNMAYQMGCENIT